MADNSGLIANALERTNPELAQEIEKDSWQVAIKKRGARVKLYRDYERGDHRASATKQMKKMLRIEDDDSGLVGFNNNYMRTVIDKMASRIFVSNISIDEQAQGWLQMILDRNRFNASQGTWYRAAVRDGDSYIIVDPDTVRWVSQPAYDGFNGIVIIYNELTRQPTWVCKIWSVADVSDVAGDENSGLTSMRLTVYQPDQVSNWKGRKGSAEVESVDEVSEWELGRIPIVSFINNVDNYTNYGDSEIRPAISLQDVLNRTLHSMVAASEFSAFRVNWSIGFELDPDGILPGAMMNMVVKDEKGKIQYELSNEQIEFLKAAKVGQFEATDISQYTEQIDKIVQQISQATQTPMFGVTMQGNLSGEALKQLEIGLLGKIERFQHQNTDAISELITLTAEIQRLFENDMDGTAPEFDPVKVIWKSPEILNIDARIKTLVELREKAPGLLVDEFYIKRIGVLLQMSEGDINDEIEKAKEERGLQLDTFVGAGGEVPVA